MDLPSQFLSTLQNHLHFRSFSHSADNIRLFPRTSPIPGASGALPSPRPYLGDACRSACVVDLSLASVPEKSPQKRQSANTSCQSQDVSGTC
jgi:hypothetical protein